MRPMSVLFVVSLFLVAGCHAPVETKQNHIVHHGEPARLVGTGQGTVYIAVAKPDNDVLVSAVDGKKQEEIDAMMKAGRALDLEAGTPVKVIGESFNEREIEITDGPQKGKKGWVPFEWLKPV